MFKPHAEKTNNAHFRLALSLGLLLTLGLACARSAARRCLSDLFACGLSRLFGPIPAGMNPWMDPLGFRRLRYRLRSSWQRSPAGPAENPPFPGYTGLGGHWGDFRFSWEPPCYTRSYALLSPVKVRVRLHLFQVRRGTVRRPFRRPPWYCICGALAVVLYLRNPQVVARQFLLQVQKEPAVRATAVVLYFFV